MSTLSDIPGLAAVTDIISNVHARASPEPTTTSPPAPLGAPAVRPLSQGHWPLSGRSPQVLAFRVHKDDGW